MERLTICLRVLAERSEVVTQVFGEMSREALGRLLETKEAESKKGDQVSDRDGLSLHTSLSPYLSPLPTILCVTQNREHEVQVHADDLIMFLQLAGQEDGQVENKYELSLMTATQGSSSAGKRAAEKTQTQLSKVR